MSISKKEIDDLKKSYELKVKIFDLIKRDETQKARDLLEKNNEALSYFKKLESEKRGSVIISGINGWGIHYSPYKENKISTELEKIKKYIEEKEARYEQQEYLKQQKEFLNLQKKDIEERVSTPQDTPQDTPQVTPQVELTELEKKILLEIQTNSKISRNELAIKLGISSDTVKEYIEKLKSKNAVRRIGKTSAGYWEILK